MPFGGIKGCGMGRFGCKAGVAKLEDSAQTIQ
jgi:hypothetical protein